MYFYSQVFMSKYAICVFIQANAPDRPHPYWKFPLQFVCTSVEEYPGCKHATDSELQVCAMAEIKAVKKMVQCCINSWPVDEWGKLDPSSICVITPTRLAVSNLFV